MNSSECVVYFMKGTSYMEDIRLPVDMAKKACNTVIARFPDVSDLPPTYKLNYHHGVFFSGLLRTYLACKDEMYYDYLKAHYEFHIDAEGNVHNEENTEELDDVQPGINMFYLYKRTGDKRYKIALDGFIDKLKNWKRNDAGGFWHKDYYPNQMWLDGLYMAGPLLAQYAHEFNDEQCLDIAIEQIKIMWEHTYDKKSGLLYHGWDASGLAEWADKKSGRAPEFWGRSIGWVGVAICDVLDYTPPNHPGRAELSEYLKKLMCAVVTYQAENGLWYQVVNKGNRRDNWTEVSCSCLFVYSLLKSIKLGIISKEYEKQAIKGYEAVLAQTENKEGRLEINNVCVGTGIGNYEYYINRPTKSGDLHGIGAFILMCMMMYEF